MVMKLYGYETAIRENKKKNKKKKTKTKTTTKQKQIDRGPTVVTLNL